jgi:predicted alpha/beta-hydrolase family hydrolase
MLPLMDDVRFEKNGVVGFLHRPEVAARCAMVLTHGAGSDCRTPLLRAAATAFCNAGVLVLRYNLPFRQKRPSGPPVPAMAADDRAGLKAAAEALRGEGGEEIYLAGHSYGGRQASMLLAEQPDLATGLLLMAYPLHPPKKPQEWRTQHFGNLRTRSVFVHGDADPFASLQELASAVSLIRAPSRLIAIPGAGHDLRRGRLDFTPVVAALLTP